MIRFASLLLGLSLLLVAGPAAAQTTHVFSAALSGGEEVPPNPSTALGFIVVTYTDHPAGDDEISVRGRFEGLGSNFTGSHLHDAPAGQNGPIVQGLTPVLAPDNRSGEWTVADNTYAVPPFSTLLNDLQAGTIYANVHSTSLPGGEIRGQLEPAGARDLVAANVTSLSVPAGGAITFQYAVTNNTGAAASGDLFFTASGGRQGRILSGTVQAMASVGPLTFTQQVPASTPPGVYDYTLHIGNFPGQSVDAVAFEVTVTPALRTSPPGDEWTVTDATPWPEAASLTAPGSAVVAYPNPFARQTAIQYAVAEATDVRLAVYDVLGREVAVLVDTPQEAGTHRATFDARGLAAGTYVYRLQVGSAVQAGRLTLAH